MVTLLKQYEMLENAGCRFVAIKPKSKRPIGPWGNESDPASLPSAQSAVARLESGKGNVAVVPGGSVYIIDFDDESAISRFDELCEQTPEFKTFVVKTPNGYHIYCLAELIDLIEVTAGKTNWGAKVDIRSSVSNSYVIGPGSHVENTEPGKNSGRYETVIDAPIAVAPPEIEGLCRKAIKVAPPASNPTKPDSDATKPGSKPTLQHCRSVVTKQLNRMAKLQPGSRNQDGFNIGTVIGSYVAQYREEFESESTPPVNRIEAAMNKTVTPNDDEAELAKNLESAIRGYETGLDNPNIGEDTKPSEPNETTAFLNICDLMGFKARFNLANKSEEWWFPDEGVWRAMIPHETYSLFARIWNEHDWNVKIQDRKTLAAFACDQNRVHPYREELLSYIDYVDPDLEGIPLENSLKWWVPNYDGEYERWCQKAIWMGIISRMFDDPQPQRTHVTLRGAAGAGKSAFVKHLLPDELGGCGKLNLSGSDRDRMSKMKGKYCVEYPEMAGMSKREAAEHKSFFGAGEMDLRILHTSDAATFKYTANIVATANEGSTIFDDLALIERFAYLVFVRNDTCNGAYNPAKWVPKIRKHFLAEALRSFLGNDERFNVIPEALKPELMKRAAPSVNTDQALNDKVALVDYNNLPLRFTAVEFAQHAGLAIGYSDYRRNRLHITLPEALRRLGFVSEMGTRGAEWWSRPPEGDYPMPNVDVKPGQIADRKRIANDAYARMNLPKRVIVNSSDLGELD